VHVEQAREELRVVRLLRLHDDSMLCDYSSIHEKTNLVRARN
jgi:hypothetical protein